MIFKFITDLIATIFYLAVVTVCLLLMGVMFCLAPIAIIGGVIWVALMPRRRTETPSQGSKGLRVDADEA